MKVCSKCHIEKDESEFRVRKGRKPHHNPIINSSCKMCEAKETKQWRQNNRTKYREQKKRWRQKESSKQRKREYCKKYREGHKESIKAYNKEYVLQNKDKVYKYRKEWSTKTGHVAKQNRRKIENITNTYLVEILKQRNFTNEQIELNPELLLIQKFKVIKHRIKKINHDKITKTRQGA